MLENSMRNRPALLVEIVVVALAVFAALAARVALSPLLGQRVPFMTFIPVTFAVAWWGGLRPTLWATGLSVLVIVYLILTPQYSFAIDVVEHRYGLGLYVAVALAVGWMGERLRAANFAAARALGDAIAEHEQLQVTLASIGDAVIVTDPDGRVALLNPVAEALTGWTLEESSGKPLEHVFRIQDETGQPVESPYANALRAGTPVRMKGNTTLLGKDGLARPIDDSAALVKDSSGRVRGVVVVCRDISEKRAAETALLRSQRELADFFEHAAIPLHSVGPDGIILRANQAELDMLGYTRDEYVGHHLADFYVDRKVVDEMLVRLSQDEVIHNREAQLRCKNGSIKDVLVTCSVFREDGRFVHTRCFTRDITDRKQGEESLNFFANASATLAALVDRESALQQSARIAVPYLADWCVVYVIDEHGNIDYHAHAHRDPSKERLLTLMLTHSPLDWNSNTATVRALKTGKSQLMAELPEPFLDSIAQGEQHREIIRQLGPRAVISVPLKIRDRIVGVIGLVNCDPSRQYTHRDVSLAEGLAERVATAVDNSRLYHAVKEASRQKDEFLAMLAHELRNPLAAIRYAVSLGQLSNGNSTGELFEIIDRQTHNLAHLIDDLLDVSRISGNKVTLRKEPVEVAAVIQRAAAISRPLMEQKRHELVLEIAPESMLLYADPTRAEQIVANLLTNAGKYTREGGRVTVRARRDNDQVVIDVIDTGVGLPPEMLSRVFDLFTQADRTLDRSEGGLGIGLTVARKLAEMHGGSISAASEGLGKGATFTVRLPLSQAPGSDHPTASFESHAADQEKLRILVVDDNRDTATSCAMWLQTLGHDIATAYDGLSALETARSFHPQVLFLDIGLPGMNGYDVARTLRDEGFQNETIVAISGYGQPDDRRRSQEAGFDDHLVKPVGPAAILSTLRIVREKQPV